MCLQCINRFRVKEKRHRSKKTLTKNVFLLLYHTRCHNMLIWRQWWIFFVYCELCMSYICSIYSPFFWNRHANQDASLNTTCVVLSKSYIGIHYFCIRAQEVKQCTHTLLCCRHSEKFTVHNLIFIKLIIPAAWKFIVQRTNREPISQMIQI